MDEPEVYMAPKHKKTLCPLKWNDSENFEGRFSPTSTNPK